MSLLTVRSIETLHDSLKSWRRSGESVAFVPTMGNLHDGHLRLVAEAGKNADRVVVSIFVNPTQFGVGEDFASYPRTESADREKLEQAGADLLFLPPATQMYSDAHQTVVSVEDLSRLHCGRSRVGHFDGVATVVCKLFNMVRPDLAFFGEKDFQQLVVIRTMVRDLNFPVEIRSVETVRESDGLAMSSRNSYLTPEQRLAAPALYCLLCHVRDSIVAGERDYSEMEKKAMLSLQEAGFQPEYFSVCRISDLKPASADDNELIVLAAARLGRTRLIDNICFTKSR